MDVLKLNHLNRKLIFAVIFFAIILLIGGIFTTIYLRSFYTDSFPIRHFEEKMIPLPGRCKYIDNGGMCFATFETKKNTAEVSEFYDTYLKSLRQATSLEENGIIGYFVEDMDYIFLEYKVFDHGDKTVFVIEYDPITEDWEFIDPY